MLYTAEKQPAVFFATCARLLPNDVRVTVERSLPGNLSPTDWQIMREIVEAVKTAVPDAASQPAGQVLEYVRARLTEETSLTGQFEVINHSEPNGCAMAGDEPK